MWKENPGAAVLAKAGHLVPLSLRFVAIIEAGNWDAVTRPIVEAFLHARFFLEMAVRYSKLNRPPNPLPSGYAALLCLYGLRWARG